MKTVFASRPMAGNARCGVIVRAATALPSEVCATFCIVKWILYYYKRRIVDFVMINVNL